jgi:hypothetical protein
MLRRSSTWHGRWPLLVSPSLGSPARQGRVWWGVFGSSFNTSWDRFWVAPPLANQGWGRLLFLIVVINDSE